MELYKKSENKRMIIIGCGRLGANLANKLYSQGHDVIVIDEDESSFRKLSSFYGGLTLMSDGTELKTFDLIEVEENDVLIVVTDNDNTNIMISQIAREIYHIKKIICRLYDPSRECVYDEFGIDTICPTYLSVNRIEEILNSKGA